MKFRTITSVIILAAIYTGCSSELSQPGTEEQQSISEPVVAKGEESETPANADSEPVEEEQDLGEAEVNMVSENGEGEGTQETTQNSASTEQVIDTSVFVYAEKVDVTDAREITNHVDVVVHMSENLKKGLAVQHVFGQTYEFLQQEDIKGAETVTIGVYSKSDGI